MSEEDQMMRAIAMSLGQEVSMEQRSDSPEVGRMTQAYKKSRPPKAVRLVPCKTYSFWGVFSVCEHQGFFF